jgi:hypothetical protein
MTPLERMAVRIADLGACQDAHDWLEELDPSWTPQQAWDACPNAGWVFWLLGRCKQPDEPNIVRASCRIARTVLHLVPAGDDRPSMAIKAAEAWADNPSEHKAYAAAAAASAVDAATFATYAAACAAFAAGAAAGAAASAVDVATYAAYAAYAAVDAATYAAYDAAVEAAACGIVREFFPHPPELD